MKECSQVLKIGQRSRSMRGVSTVSFVILLALTIPASDSYGQLGSSSHSVTVSVQEITVLQTSLGIINLQITGLNVIAGQNTMTATNQSSILSWGTNAANRKITAKTNLPAPIFTLKALATNPSQGTAAPEQTLSTTPTNFMLNIGRSSGLCTINYTGIATADQGFGTDSHLITFTIQSQ